MLMTSCGSSPPSFSSCANTSISLLTDFAGNPFAGALPLPLGSLYMYLPLSASEVVLGISPSCEDGMRRGIERQGRNREASEWGSRPWLMYASFCTCSPVLSPFYGKSFAASCLVRYICPTPLHSGLAMPLPAWYPGLLRTAPVLSPCSLPALRLLMAPSSNNILHLHFHFL